MIFSPTLMREIPRLLLQSDRSPFLGIVTIEAEFHFLGKDPMMEPKLYGF